MDGGYVLGKISYKGNGVDKDESIAAAFFDKSCQGGNPDGCKSRDMLRTQ